MALLQQAQLEGSADGYTKRRVGIDDCGELDANGEAIEEVATAAAERPEAEVAAEEELEGLVLGIFTCEMLLKMLGLGLCSGKHSYFAYGSNLCVRQMAQRCP